jgi:hypothetical protein
MFRRSLPQQILWGLNPVRQREPLFADEDMPPNDT